MESTEKAIMLHKTLGGLSLTDEQIDGLSENARSVFTGENDFCSSLEFFLDFNIGEIKT